MKHEVLKPIQKEWLGWLLQERRRWLRGKVDSVRDHQRLDWSHSSGLYDVATKQLLNVILKEFNEDKEISNEWNKIRKIEMNDWPLRSRIK